jgi:hypothetical protein
MSAFHLEHWESPVIPSQSQTLPQSIGDIQLARRPNATMKITKQTKSTGQWRKVVANGNRNKIDTTIPIAATTSV